MELDAAQLDREVSEWPGFGLTLPIEAGPTHPYIGASPACWALFGEVLPEFAPREAG